MPCRVLLVDDDPGNREVLSRLLLKLGAVSLAVAAGEDVFPLMNQGEKFDLVLLDYHLPGVSGVHTAEILRQNPKCPKLACLTGDAVEVTGLFDFYLQKPIRLSQLEEILAQTCFPQR